MLLNKNKKNGNVLFFIQSVFVCAALFALAVFLVNFFSPGKESLILKNEIKSGSSISPLESANEKTPEEYQRWLNTLRSPSQYDTQIDGALREDENGNLVVERGVRDLFDYFMTGVAGERPLEEIIHSIFLYIDETLSPSAAKQAKELLENYVDYEMAQEAYHNSLTMNPYSLEGMEAVNYYEALLDHREQLRSDYLGNNAREQFYGDEEAYDRFTLERMRLARSQISEEQKEIAYEQLVEQLPNSIKPWYKEQEKIYSYLDEELNKSSELVSSLDKEKTRQDRIVKYGPEAANRLEELEKKNHEWDSRIKNYINVRDDILSSEALSETEKQEQLQKFIIDNFDKKEQMRVKPSASLLEKQNR